MKNRFYYELIVGIIGIAAVLVFGQPGFAALALLAGYGFMKRTKADEREYQLFYKVGNITAALTLLIAIAIFFGSNLSLNGKPVGDLWLYLLCFSFLLVHGLSGLIVFNRS